MITNKRHDQIVNSHRISADSAYKAAMADAERAREALKDIDAAARASYERWEAEKLAMIDDLEKLSAQVIELNEHKRSSERVIEHLRAANTELVGRARGHAEVVSALEDALEAKLDAERELEIYQQREKANRKKAAKERDAEVKAARKARKIAAENGEQWAVEAILNPPRLGMFG